MNYFEFYGGDYTRDTAHLSLSEHGAFLLLLTTYYSTEKPLPADLGAVQRIARAVTTDEQQAAARVAEEFFPVAEDGLRHNDRADKEIEKARKRIETARDNGRRGGRRPNGIAKENPAGNPVGSDPVTQPQPDGQALHTPYTTNKNNNTCASGDAPTPKSDSIPYQAIVDRYNGTMVGLAKVRVLTAKRRTAIRAVWQASDKFRSERFFEAFFAECQEVPFLNGTGPYTNGHENWRPDFDYLMQPKVATRVYEKAMQEMEAEDAH